MSNTPNNSGERQERGNYVPGYEPVLLRSETKKRLKEYRFNQVSMPRDMHIERHMVTAAIDFVLSDETVQQKWMDLVKQSLLHDIGQTVNSGLSSQPA